MSVQISTLNRILSHNITLHQPNKLLSSKTIIQFSNNNLAIAIQIISSKYKMNMTILTQQRLQQLPLRPLQQQQILFQIIEMILIAQLL